MTIKELSIGKKVIDGFRYAAKPALELTEKLSEKSREEIATALIEIVEIIRMLNTMNSEQREKVISELVNEAQKIRQSIKQTGSIN